MQIIQKVTFDFYLQEFTGNLELEDACRNISVSMGCIAAFGIPPNRGSHVKKFAVRDTMSYCWNIGVSILNAERKKVDVLESLLKETPGAKLFFKGKGKLLQNGSKF